MEGKPMDTMEDYLARLNFEGQRRMWRKNHRKIDCLLAKCRKDLRKARTSCEIGPGDGHLLRRLHARGMAVTGVDISQYIIDRLREDFRAEGIPATLIQANAAQASFGQGAFDAAFCLDVLEHIPGEGMKRAVQRLHQGLAAGGVLVATLPLHEQLDDGMVMCPNCRHQFHRIGHFHSFADLRAVRAVFEPEFQVLRTWVVPFGPFRSRLLNAAAFRVYLWLCRAAGVRVVTTVYVVARKAGAGPMEGRP
jgi:SAM-dependent methyltransferase